MAVEQSSAYVAFNSMTRGLRRHCASYLSSLGSLAMSEVAGYMTVLDRHRLNHCKLEIEAVLRRVEANGELVDNRFLKIAMLHVRRHLCTIRSLCKDVSFR